MTILMSSAPSFASLSLTASALRRRPAAVSGATSSNVLRWKVTTTVVMCPAEDQSSSSISARAAASGGGVRHHHLHCGRTGEAAEAVSATVSGWELGRALVATLGGGGGPFKVAHAGIDLAWLRADSLRSSSCSADLFGCNESLWWSGGWLARFLGVLHAEQAEQQQRGPCAQDLALGLAASRVVAEGALLCGASAIEL
jgi:hypothetical protein